MKSDHVYICFLAPWIQGDSYLKDSVNMLTPNGDGAWGSLVGTSDPELADYVVVLDQETSLSKSIPFSKKIYLQREPPEIRPTSDTDYEHRNRDKYFFFGDHAHHYQVSVPWIHVPYRTLCNSDYVSRKGVVAICSGKNGTVSQKSRLALLKWLAQSGFPIDIYGRGLDPSQFNGCYRGAIEGRCKYKILCQYRYALVCENSEHPGYFTEKINDCFLSLTMPIYRGCPDIKRYFPANSLHIYEDGDLSHLPPIDTDALYVARDLVLNRYNIWPSVESIITTKGKIV